MEKTVVYTRTGHGTCSKMKVVPVSCMYDRKKMIPVNALNCDLNTCKFSECFYHNEKLSENTDKYLSNIIWDN